jgi:N-acetylated-alpha-linked acidic dipeptidase
MTVILSGAKRSDSGVLRSRRISCIAKDPSTPHFSLRSKCSAQDDMLNVVRVWLALVLVAIFPNISSAQMTGFSPANARTEVAIEKKLVDEIKPDTLRAIVSAISKKVHVAGTSEQIVTRDYVINRWKKAGLSTKVYPYEVDIPLAKSSSLEMLSPEKKTFDLHEDRTSYDPNDKEYPWVNGYSASGTASGDVVYVNYGLHEDYHTLDSLHISVKGKIAIARYGKSYRGIKAQLAELHGAAGLIIYSDPSGDGYDEGDVFPGGPMRSSGSVQRGSFYNGHGDPTTPGYASVPGARRVPADSMYATPKIPVIPIPYGIAQEILSAMHGHDIPNSRWQGGLAFRYHIESADTAPVRVKLNVECDTGLKPIWNTVATITGSTWPDEWIIIGGHRDAWCYGTEDNASGCASSVAAAEAFAKLQAEGIRPKRSVMFVTWDAEEWGLLGSTEWVEQLEKELGIKAIAYINQDMCATGTSFSASADPSLRTLVYEVSKSVNDGSGNPIYDKWKASKDGQPEIGLLGGGSDFSAFYNHLGIPSLEHGFGGPFGQYHSNHDNIGWTLHYGDSNFRYHAASSQFAAVEAMRLANADVLPFDFAALGTWLRTAVKHEKVLAMKNMHDSAGFAPLENVIDSFIIASKAFADVRDKNALAEKSQLLSDPAIEDSVNQALRSVGFAFTAPEGLFFDKWERNMLVLADPENGYADMELPALGVAFRRKDGYLANVATIELIRAVKKATSILESVTASLSTM